MNRIKTSGDTERLICDREGVKTGSTKFTRMSSEPSDTTACTITHETHLNACRWEDPQIGLRLQPILSVARVTPVRKETAHLYTGSHPRGRRSSACRCTPVCCLCTCCCGRRRHRPHMELGKKKKAANKNKTKFINWIDLINHKTIKKKEDNNTRHILLPCQTQNPGDENCSILSAERQNKGTELTALPPWWIAVFTPTLVPLWIITHQIRLTYFCLPLYSLLPVFPRLSQATPFCFSLSIALSLSHALSLFRVPLLLSPNEEQPAEGALLLLAEPSLSTVQNLQLEISNFRTFQDTFCPQKHLHQPKLAPKRGVDKKKKWSVSPQSSKAHVQAATWGLDYNC